MSEIVKVQVPLFTNDPQHDNGTRGLVYAKGRKHLKEQPLPLAVLKSLGEEVKGFFLAEWDDDLEEWLIGERTKGHTW